MKIIGKKIKEARKAKKMNQKSLSEGICSQSALSNIENKNICKDFNVLISLCERLELNFEDCVTEVESQYLDNALKKVNALCMQLKHSEAYQVIKEIKFNPNKVNKELNSKFLFFKGHTALLGNNDHEEALNFLLKGSQSDNGLTIYNVLSLNSLGTLHELQKNYSQAKVYYDKSVQLLEKFKYSSPQEACRMFYNTAKFYSDIKEYENALVYSEKGLEVARHCSKNYFLEYLLYEKAYNLNRLGRPAKEEYEQALVFAEYFQNEGILTYIKNDINTFFNNTKEKSM
ncbi:helix-turn-helix domain-containing protein (plasmid) [Enterococcus faecalis]|uniref:helix-turn-helix domain-containing protein n=1 Tax=Enterococcus faecalis TaxID=1351 RepID=UPI0029C69C2E|nr:helix-turn-helix domain-containing protein [Enterococcus faecalis]WPH48359.1 helix-turn-helix domain-containing protein [Enterococcus faecalis]